MQIPKLRSVLIGFLSVLAVTLLFSCSKNVADSLKLIVEEATSTNPSNNAANDNIIHAVPFETTLFVPCANGGAGEDVVLPVSQILFTGSRGPIADLPWSIMTMFTR